MYWGDGSGVFFPDPFIFTIFADPFIFTIFAFIFVQFVLFL